MISEMRQSFNCNHGEPGGILSQKQGMAQGGLDGVCFLRVDVHTTKVTSYSVCEYTDLWITRS